MLLAGVELEAHLPVDVAIHLLIGTCQALGRKIAGEIDNRLVACAFLIGDIDISACAGLELRSHAPPLPSEIRCSHHRGNGCIQTVLFRHTALQASLDEHPMRHSGARLLRRELPEQTAQGRA